MIIITTSQVLLYSQKNTISNVGIAVKVDVNIVRTATIKKRTGL